MKKLKFSPRNNLYIAVCGLLLILGLLTYYAFSSVSNVATTQYIYIDEDDTQDSVIAKIQPFANLIGMTTLNTLIRHSGYSENIRTGRYAIEPGDGPITLFRRLRSGRQTSLNLTIPESRTMDRLAAILSNKLMLDSATIAEALTSQEVCEQLGYDTCTIAAMFVPNTYDVYWNMSMDELLQRMKKEHDRFWKGDREAKAAKMQITPIEVCTLASIIDEETSNNAEKPMIAGMYLNRLKEGMPLQADPTIKFALKQFELKRIYNKLLNTESPYNTYRNEGLPPGPIKIASIKGIDAVLNYTSHDYLYMCAKEDFSGTHNFARTYQEHLENAEKYTKALNERGIQ
jgi:UPF0755 protein